MKRSLAPLAAAVIAAGGVLLAACAGDSQSERARIAEGRVQALYVERAPGVLVDHRVSRDGSDTRRWAAVSLRKPLDDGRTFTTAAVDAATALEVGDTVQVALGASPGNPHEPARVQAIVSRRAERAARLNIKGPRWAS